MQRRDFLAAAASPVVAAAAAAGIPVVDTHIHLFDPDRPQGIPWPPKNNAKLYKAALPPRFRKLATGHGVVAAIEVECSPWPDDNQWVLDVMAKDDIMVGTIGNLEPGRGEFRSLLDRFRKNPLFLGIRYGNLWDRDFHAGVGNPKVIADLKYLADLGLTMDTANPNPALLDDLNRLMDAVPKLRLVIDHLPRLNPPTGAAERKTFDAALKNLGARPTVYSKLSGVPRPNAQGVVPPHPAFYKQRLDDLFGIFGEDRVIYGSDWPNSDNYAEYHVGFNIVKDYFSHKSPAAAEKYFWRNSVAAYRWKPRTPQQPKP